MKSPLLALAILPLVASMAAAQDGGIEIFAGETIFAEGTRVSLAHIWKTKEGLLDGSSSISDEDSQRFVEHRTVLGINHGIARGWSLSALIPYVERSLDTNKVILDRRGSGAGDVSLILKRRFHVDDWNRSAWHSAWIAGVELPTGETGERDGGVRLDPSLQPGSGSMDPFLGLASTLDLDLWRFDAVALYKENTEGAQDYEEGDKLTLALSGKCRFLHEKYPGPSASATVGLKWSHTWRSSSDGLTKQDSGGEALLVKFGLGYHPRPNIDMGVSLDLPLYEDLNGTQLGLDSRVQLSLGFRF
jgi:hypothetical protein